MTEMICSKEIWSGIWCISGVLSGGYWNNLGNKDRH